MPHMVRKQVKVAHVRVNDRLAENGAQVVGRVLKQKWAYLTLALPNDETKTVRMPMDNLIDVEREEPTDEEKQAANNETIRKMLSDLLRGMLDKTPLNALEAIVAKTKASEYDHEVLTSFNLQDVLKTQAMYKQALMIRGYLYSMTDDNRKNVAIEDATLDELVTAYAAWRYRNTDRRSPIDPTSRSTSALSNLIEDLDVWAISEIRQQVMWTGANEQINARIEVFNADARSRRS